MAGKEKAVPKTANVGEAAFYRTIMEEARDIVLVVGNDGQIQYTNKAAIVAYGYSREALCQLFIQDLRAADSPAVIADQMQEAKQKGTLFRTFHQRANGQLFPVEVSSRSILFADQEALVSIVRDITETVEMEKSLEERREALYKANEELTATHEELVASEEELRQQFDELLTRDEAIYHQNMILTALHETALGLMQRRDFDELLQMLVVTATKMMQTSDGWLYLVDEQRRYFVKKVATGAIACNFHDTLSLKEGLIGEAYQTKKMAIAYDYSQWSGRFVDPAYEECYTVTQVPLLCEGQVVGVLGLAFSEQRRNLIREEVLLLQQIVDLAAIAFDNVSSIMSYRQEIAEHKRTEEALRQSEMNYRTVFEAANDGILLHDEQTGQILDVNNTACLMYGYSYQEMLDSQINVIGIGEAPYCHQSMMAWIQRTVQEGPQLFEWCKLRRDGSVIWVEANFKRILLGNEYRILSIVRDISERKQQEIELRKSQESTKALITAIPDPLFVMRRDGTFLNFIAKQEEADLLPQFFLGKKVSDLFSAETAELILVQIARALDSGKPQIFEKEIVAKNKKEEYEFRIVASGEDEVLAIGRNITDRKRMQSELEYLSLHDALTDLYNRAFFEEEMKRFQRERKGAAGILVFDVDGLKMINDTLGHAVGDLILKDVARILKASFRSADIVARIGGDEFSVVLPDAVAAVYEDHCRQIRQQIVSYNAHGPTVPLSLSMGFAISREQSLDMVALFKEADNNMYREKVKRQKTVRADIIESLVKALEKRDFIIEGHGERMQKLLVAFASQLGLPDSQGEELRLFAHFHDIGKVGIPDRILFKSEQLLDEEWIIMRQHPEIGYRIAIASPDLSLIADLILKHQEWWNGQGYPLGLKADAIPLACRMLTIVDAFDAITSERPYRKARDKQQAITEIRSYAGIQFDPTLANVFCNMVDRNFE